MYHVWLFSKVKISTQQKYSIDAISAIADQEQYASDKANLIQVNAFKYTRDR